MCKVADIEIVASYDDLKAIQHLAEISDVVTYEFENIDYRCLQWLENMLTYRKAVSC